MSDLIEFLRARLDEDAHIAEAAAGATWGIGHTLREWSGGTPNRGLTAFQTWADTHSHIYAARPDNRMVADMSDHSTKPRNVANSEHIARWDPASVLAEVNSKRQIIELCQDSIDADQAAPGTAWVAGMVLGHRVLERMAAPYTAHPDFNPAWAVEAADA